MRQEEMERSVVPYSDQQSRAEIRQRYARMRADEGIQMDTYGSVAFATLTAKDQIWSTALSGIKGDLVWVGVGLVAGGVASVWSTWI